jgi:hypothetical protein
MEQGSDLLRITLQWIGAMALAGTGWLLTKINALENRMDTRIESMEARAVAARDKQWTAIEAIRRDLSDFSRTTPTKEDLRDMEVRITAAMGRMLNK